MPLTSRSTDSVLTTGAVAAGAVLREHSLHEYAAMVIHSLRWLTRMRS